ncbi:radical SAM/SPASM domain-containing protein [Herbaspirillum huttiense]|uniref:SPASM domain-containing protein n=1 Tax=Herbaspirillum huttiense subsp. lycopersici TaxID=3074428 RepID=A0ABU2EFU2_9BURK|nr:radical SAM protein [Herbaspirillum huttiense]MDR9847003.1 SPASM domain-containing protein [Herbaspirillum huttiense SE1]
MTYRLTMRDAQGQDSFLLYNAHTNSLTDESGVPVAMDYQPEKPWRHAVAISPDEPGLKVATPTRIKIQLGLKCNYSCSYCLQSAEIPDASASSMADVEAFLANLDTWLKSAPERIEFWGGEPFVYWAHLKRLVPAMREKFPNAQFVTVSNGSLLDDEKIDFIDRYDIRMGISHDAMGQHLRGPDPMDEPGRVEIFQRLIDRRPHGAITFNAVLTAGNCDVDAITEWIQKRLDRKVPVTFEGVVHSYDQENKGDVAKWGAEQYSQLQFNVVKAMVQGTEAGYYSTIGQKAVRFLDSLKARRPAAAISQKCGMDTPNNLAVDLKGNVTTCQNVGAAGKHGIGHVSDIPGVRLTSSWHWSKRETCNSCPVLQLCQGACMYNEGDDFAQSCENEFHFNSAIMAGALYWLTGKMLVHVEGDIRRPKKRKVIPIALAG